MALQSSQCSLGRWDVGGMISGKRIDCFDKNKTTKQSLNVLQMSQQCQSGVDVEFSSDRCRRGL